MATSEAPGRRRGLVRAPQDAVAGAVVILAASGVLLALQSITTTSYQAFSPALFPRVCAWLAVAGGLALVLRSLLRDGAALPRFPFRSAILVTLALLLFGVVTPRLGYAAGGLLAVIVGGLATPEARARELAALAVGLLTGSVLLFSVLLKLPLPILILPGLGPG